MSNLWNKSIEIGVDLIDEQHRELFERFDSLINAINMGEGSDKIEPLMGFLGEYVVTHFNDEEKLMDKAGYPEIDNHKILHHDFVKYFSDVSDKIVEDGVNDQIAHDVKKKLFDWLWTHIANEDKKIGCFIDLS